MRTIKNNDDEGRSNGSVWRGALAVKRVRTGRPTRSRVPFRDASRAANAGGARVERQHHDSRIQRQ